MHRSRRGGRDHQLCRDVAAIAKVFGERQVDQPRRRVALRLAERDG
ncbi:MAG: hypothetical protein U0992_18380 [Planctomycetaceae bacterium]